MNDNPVKEIKIFDLEQYKKFFRKYYEFNYSPAVDYEVANGNEIYTEPIIWSRRTFANYVPNRTFEEIVKFSSYVRELHLKELKKFKEKGILFRKSQTTLAICPESKNYHSHSYFKNETLFTSKTELLWSVPYKGYFESSFEDAFNHMKSDRINHEVNLAIYLFTYNEMTDDFNVEIAFLLQNDEDYDDLKIKAHFLTN